MPPDLWPCPAGFRAATVSGFEVCEPFGEDIDPNACSSDELVLPGMDACAPVGSPCPVEGRFATAMPSSAVFVDSAAGAPGDGSRESPFQTLGEAIASLPMGGIIGLASGTYDAGLTMRVPLSLIGACATGTIVAASEGSAVIDVESAVVRMRDITLTGAVPGVTVRGSGARVALEDVIVSEVMGKGLSVEEGAALETTRTLVRGVRASPLGEGVGVRVDSGGTASIAETLITEIQTAAVSVTGEGSTAVIRDSVLFQVDPRPSDAAYGAGFLVLRGGRGEIRRSFIGQVSFVAAGASAGAELVAEDLVVTDVIREPMRNTFGHALLAGPRSRVEARRVFARRPAFAGLIASGGSLILQDIVVLDVGGPTETDIGAGLVALDAVSVDVNRFALDGFVGVGIFHSGGQLTLRDASVARGRVGSTEGADGLVLDSPEGATLERIRVSGALRTGVSAEDGDIVIRDLHVENVRPTGVGMEGDISEGLAMPEDANVTIERALFRDIMSAGINVSSSSKLTITDLTMDELVRREDGIARALQVFGGATLVMERATISRYGDAAVAIAMASAELRDVAILDALAEESPPEPPYLRLYGRGIAVGNGGRAQLERVRIERSRESAITVGDRSSLTGSHLSISDVRGIEGGTFGHAIEGSGGSSVELSYLTIDRAREVAVAAFGEGSTVSLEEAWIRDTRARGCVETVCPEFPGGIGIGAYSGGQVTARRFRVEESAFIGIQVSRGGRVSLTEGVVRDNPIGVNIGSESPTSVSHTDVAFSGNVRNLDGHELPVPSQSL